MRWHRSYKTVGGRKTTDTVYTSDCGRYRIERRRYVTPTKHSEWRLFEGHECHDDFETLSEAKEIAEDLSHVVPHHERGLSSCRQEP